ncbi:hypothetical protein [Jiulongibacter sediminis]|jgi:hypothetical protein|uniref:hypothetical protein n=1 Tax=Jiulongibacter sediminis TaxID=1605367 RepID=UPI0026EC1B71|nr:hypothetical protein [Jiulongibacter sediminis]
MNSIVPHKEKFAFRFLGYLFITAIGFVISELKTGSPFLGFVVLIIVFFLLLNERDAETVVKRLSVLDDGRFQIILIVKKQIKEINTEAENIQIKVKRNVNGRVLGPYYKIYLHLKDHGKIEMSSLQGWSSDELIDFLKANRIEYCLT